MNYILLEEHNSTQLIKKVNALLIAGWVCQGGISYNPTKQLYLQALIIDEHILPSPQSNGVRPTTRGQTRGQNDS